MHIVVGPRSIESLFGASTRIAVPNFQRNYAWTPTQITEFMDDVLEAAQDEHPHFWGPIVLLKDRDDPDLYEVIDGQQRLTTAVIMLSLLRDEAYSFENRLIYEGEPGEHNLYSKFRNILFLPPTFSKSRFTANYLVEKAFSTSIIPDPTNASGERRPNLSPGGAGMSSTEKKNTKELRKAYVSLRRRLQDEAEKYQTEPERKIFLDSVFRALTSNFEIHAMVLDNQSDAFILFETLNNRGLRLNPADLLKTRTLKEIRENSSQNKFASALTLWDRTTSNLGDYDFSKFLRHYLLTQSTNKIQSNKVFREFEAAIERLQPNGAEKNLVQLNKASEIYAQLLNEEANPDNELQQSFARMDSYSDTHRVFLLGMMLVELNKDERRKLARAIEMLSFRWISAGKNAQELETIYQKLSHQLSGSKKPIPVSSVVENIVEFAPSNDALSQLYRKDSVDLQRYALRRIEESVASKELDWLVKTQVGTLAPDAPANESYWEDLIAPFETNDGDDDYEDFSTMIGNFVLLEKKLLKAIDSEVWPTKVSGGSGILGLGASKFKTTIACCKVDQWSRSHIESRSSWIQDSILALTSEDWVRTGVAKIRNWTPN